MIAADRIPRDAALPWLALALDPAAMRAELEAHLDIGIERCRIDRVKYKPGRSCLISYALDLRLAASDQRYEQVLCARMYPPNTSASRYAKAMQTPLAAAAVPAPLLHLPALDMIVWAFPNERKLASLARLTDDVWLRRTTLPALVARLHGPDWCLEHSTHEMVHYVPEHTCTIRATLDVRRGDGLREHSVVYGKAYYDDTGRHVGDAMRQLWQSRAVSSGALGIARPLDYEARNRVLWQEGLPGDTLEQRHPDDAISDATLRRVAGALAALHGTPVAQIPSLRGADVLALLRDRAEIIGYAHPQARPRLEHIVAGLSATPPPSSPIATLHGDLHPKNVFLMGERVSLIDLDNIHRGPAEHDLASWTACVLYRACLRHESPARALDAAARFAMHYEHERGAHVDPRALAWYTAAALVNERAYRTLSRLKAGRMEVLDDLLALAARTMADGGTADATHEARVR